jgi:hypothetical protein
VLDNSAQLLSEVRQFCEKRKRSPTILQRLMRRRGTSGSRRCETPQSLHRQTRGKAEPLGAANAQDFA